MKTNELDIAIEALQDIANPVEYLRKQLEPGYELNGQFAIMFAEKGDNLSRIAQAALDKIDNNSIR